jgi:hypothetical protein
MIMAILKFITIFMKIIDYNYKNNYKMSSSDYNLLTKDYEETENYSKSLSDKPGYIRGLYCDIWIPNYSFENEFEISSDETKGNLYMKRDNGIIILTWNGYLSRNYDGRLCLYQMNSEFGRFKSSLDDSKAKINGSFESSKREIKSYSFQIEEDKLIEGIWPRFLYLYVKNK